MVPDFSVKLNWLGAGEKWKCLFLKECIKYNMVASKFGTFSALVVAVSSLNASVLYIPLPGSKSH